LKTFSVALAYSSGRYPVLYVLSKVLSPYSPYLSLFNTGVSILGLGVQPPDFGQGGRGLVVKYYILSCTGSMFESGDFSSEIE